MIELFAALIWLLCSTLTVVCGWKAWNGPSARRRRYWAKRGKPQMGPLAWVSLAVVMLAVAGVSGFIVLGGPERTLYRWLGWQAQGPAGNDPLGGASLLDVE